MLEHTGLTPSYPPAAQPYPTQPPLTPPPTPAPPYVAPAQADYQAPETQATNNLNQYPVDYLNQIATPLPVKKASPLLVFGLIGGVLLTVGLALFMVIQSTAPPNVSMQLYSLQTRLDTLDRVSNEQGARLTQNNLSSINSTLDTTIKSMQANLKSYMDSKGYKDTKTIATVKKTESSYYDKLSQGLNDAYLTGTLDRSYSSEMPYQLTVLKSKLQKLKAAANSKSFTEFYDKNVPSLNIAIDQLAKFQSTK